MDVLVIGMGISGRAAASFLLQSGKQVIGVDKCSEKARTLAPEGMRVFSEEEPLEWSTIDFVVVSPGISPVNPVYKQALVNKKLIVGEVELAARNLTDKVWVGITGTNGKTTTTLLVEHILHKSGKDAKAVGNVGTPLTQEVSQIQDEILVAELSSYQLETFTTPVLDTAVILNITPDHLDRYESMETYAEAKLLISRVMKENASLYLFEDIETEWKPLLSSIHYKTFGYNKNCFAYTDLENIFVEGVLNGKLPKEFHGRKSHDIENYLATYLLCKDLGLSNEEIEEGFSTFKKPAHRVEFVRCVKGVTYYDDSKGTNLDAVIKAVQALPSKIVLIAGGVHKGSSYKVWKEAFGDKVKAICVIGQAAPLIYEDLSPYFKVELCENLEKAVVLSHTLADHGESVLLSPGCSSFDMFRDYAHRGEEFKRYVWGIIE